MVKFVCVGSCLIVCVGVSRTPVGGCSSVQVSLRGVVGLWCCSCQPTRRRTIPTIVLGIELAAVEKIARYCRELNSLLSRTKLATVGYCTRYCRENSSLMSRTLLATVDNLALHCGVMSSLLSGT